MALRKIFPGLDPAGTIFLFGAALFLALPENLPHLYAVCGSVFLGGADVFGRHNSRGQAQLWKGRRLVRKHSWRRFIAAASVIEAALNERHEGVPVTVDLDTA